MPVTLDRPDAPEALSTERDAAAPGPLAIDPQMMAAMRAERLRAEALADFSRWAAPRAEQFFFSRTPFFETRVSDLYAHTAAIDPDERPYWERHQRRFRDGMGRAARLDPPRPH